MYQVLTATLWSRYCFSPRSQWGGHREFGNLPKVVLLEKWQSRDLNPQSDIRIWTHRQQTITKHASIKSEERKLCYKRLNLFHENCDVHFLKRWWFIVFFLFIDLMCVGVEGPNLNVRVLFKCRFLVFMTQYFCTWNMNSVTEHRAYFSAQMFLS